MKQLWIAAVAGVFLVAGPLRADEAKDIRDVIGDQIQAFEADDLSTAYSFASPDIQSIFRTPEIFGSMVRRGYPMIWRPSEVIYYGLRSESGQMVQRMGFRDPGGQVHLFDYEMEIGPDGWRVDGVIPVREAGEAV
jgi:hypothetical protein